LRREGWPRGAGPIFEYAASSRVGILGGHYFTRRQAVNDWCPTHRMFGGAEATAISARRFDADLRMIAVGLRAGLRPLSRAVRVKAKVQVAPYASVSGFRTGRGSAACSIRVAWAAGVDFGNFFESWRANNGGDRHTILTTFHFRRQGRRPDPDI
jgi:hypothetical protein